VISEINKTETIMKVENLSTLRHWVSFTLQTKFKKWNLYNLPVHSCHWQWGSFWPV